MLFSYLIHLVFALLIFIVIFYIPGNIILHKFSRHLSSNLFLCFGVGIAVWALQSYFSGLIGIRWFPWFYILLCLLIFVRGKTNKVPDLSFIHDHRLLIIVLLGSLLQLITVITSGVRTADGIWFFNVNLRDGIYYLTLANNLANRVPPFEPGFSGQQLINYHYLANLIISDVHRMFAISLIELQFFIFPLFLAVVLGFLVYIFGKIFTKFAVGGILSVIIFYFSSDFGYLITLILLGKASITELQVIDQPVFLFVNPQRAFAYILLLTGLILLNKSQKRRFNQKLFLFAGMVLALCIGFKIYVGIFAVLVYLTVALLNLVTGKQNVAFLAKVTAIIAFESASIFLPTNSHAGGLIWAPFAWPKHFIASTVLQNTRMHLKEIVYKDAHNLIHLAILYLQFSVIFFITNLSVKLTGFFVILFKKARTIFINSILINTLVFIFIGLLFLQKSGLYETFNFFVIAAFTLTFLTAYVLTHVSEKLAIVSFVLIMFTFPRTFIEASGQISQSFQKDRNAYLININEINAMEYIKKYSTDNSVILVLPPNYLDSQTPYVEFFSGRQTYLSGKEVLEAHSQNISARVKIVNQIINAEDYSQFIKLIKEAKINLVYIVKTNPILTKFQFDSNTVLYQNAGVIVIRV